MVKSVTLKRIGRAIKSRSKSAFRKAKEGITRLYLKLESRKMKRQYGVRPLICSPKSIFSDKMLKLLKRRRVELIRVWVDPERRQIIHMSYKIRDSQDVFATRDRSTIFYLNRGRRKKVNSIIYELGEDNEVINRDSKTFDGKICYGGNESRAPLRVDLRKDRVLALIAGICIEKAERIWQKRKEEISQRNIAMGYEEDDLTPVPGISRKELEAKRLARETEDEIIQMIYDTVNECHDNTIKRSSSEYEDPNRGERLIGNLIAKEKVCTVCALTVCAIIEVLSSPEKMNEILKRFKSKMRVEHPFLIGRARFERASQRMNMYGRSDVHAWAVYENEGRHTVIDCSMEAIGRPEELAINYPNFLWNSVNYLLSFPVPETLPSELPNKRMA